MNAVRGQRFTPREGSEVLLKENVVDQLTSDIAKAKRFNPRSTNPFLKHRACQNICLFQVVPVAPVLLRSVEPSIWVLLLLSFISTMELHRTEYRVTVCLTSVKGRS